MSEETLPTRTELLAQAVNGDMTRILTSSPPRALIIARRLKRTRHVLGAASATAFGAAVAAAALGGGGIVAPVLTAAVALGLAAVAVWAGSIVAGRTARRALFAAYSVAPRQDGMFELLLADGAEPHADLPAATAAWRVYGPAHNPTHDDDDPVRAAA